MKPPVIARHDDSPGAEREDWIKAYESLKKKQKIAISDDENKENIPLGNENSKLTQPEQEVIEEGGHKLPYKEFNLPGSFHYFKEPDELWFGIRDPYQGQGGQGKVSYVVDVNEDMKALKVLGFAGKSKTQISNYQKRTTEILTQLGRKPYSYYARYFPKPVPLFKGAIKQFGVGEEREVDVKLYELQDWEDGTDLFTLLQENKLDDVQRLLGAWRLSLLITKIHQLRVVHRDIKPENIMFDFFTKDLYDFKVKLLDLASSMILPPDLVGLRFEENIIDGSTLNYLPPRLSAQKEVSYNNDVFALLKVILYRIKIDDRDMKESFEMYQKEEGCVVKAIDIAAHLQNKLIKSLPPEIINTAHFRKNMTEFQLLRVVELARVVVGEKVECPITKQLKGLVDNVSPYFSDMISQIREFLLSYRETPPNDELSCEVLINFLNRIDKKMSNKPLAAQIDQVVSFLNTRECYFADEVKVVNHDRARQKP